MDTDTHLNRILDGRRGQGREALLPVLWDIQTQSGHIGPAAVGAISHALSIPEAEIYGVVAFYSLFSERPTGRRIIRVCTDPSCALAGADDLLDRTCARLGIQQGETTADGAYTVEHSSCLGLCEQTPAALISDREVGEHSVTHATMDTLLDDGSSGDYSITAIGNPAILLAGVSNTAESLAEYGDYAALRRVVQEFDPDSVIDMVQASGLLGRGGAEFPTNLKWTYTRRADGSPKYLVCNADESEPGTFKDRILMETRPHLLLEGIAIACYAIGAERAYLFIRGEYPKATERLTQAIQEAEQGGMLGEGIVGSEVTVRVEIRRGAGAYICGEETALFEAIEGKRGFPRMKPPYPTTHGLFKKPTVVNNVETLCAVPGIIQHGPDWFRQYGTEGSTGTKLVSVSGHVYRPGVYEIVPGISLREILDTLCLGVQGQLQAVLVGGASGTFLAPDEINVSYSFEGLHAAGAAVGSGAIMVFNQTVDLRDVMKRLARFFRHESCGKCFPCQLGTQRQVEILDRIDNPLAGDRQRLSDIGLTMAEASICGLGQTAASAILSALKRFPHLFAEA
jgi:NADH-quinone oxidoreductase subunit F